MEAAELSKPLVKTYETVWNHNPENHNLNFCCHKVIKFHLDDCWTLNTAIQYMVFLICIWEVQG